MASRRQTPPAAQNGKVRFILVDADINNESLGQLVNAITTALRPQPAPARRMLASGQMEAFEADLEEDIDQIDETDEDLPEQTSRPAVKVARPARKYPAPNVINVDLDSPVSFEEFAKQKGPKKKSKQYLVVAAWFKEHRQTDAIGADHVYTCFKKIGWSTATKNFGQPLIDLAGNDWGTYANGLFSINHIGLDVVTKMTPE